VIDEQHFFIRGCLEVPVSDGPGPFVWGVWCSLWVAITLIVSPIVLGMIGACFGLL